MTTKKNATEIAKHLENATSSLSVALSDIKKAGNLAANDYPGNDEAIKDIEASLRVIRGIISVKLDMWLRFASCR